MARLAEVWGTFKKPNGSSDIYALKNRFYIINLDNVTWHMGSADYTWRGAGKWVIKFYHKNRHIHSMKIYDKELALDMLRYLDEFRPKEDHGTFVFAGRTIDIDDVVLISNKYYNNEDNEKGYTVAVRTKDGIIKKGASTLLTGRDILAEIQKQFIRWYE